jgi:outer membrane receptor protein involved in Fe transport
VITPDDYTNRSTYTNRVTEKALFGEISYDLLDQLTLTLGGRVFRISHATPSDPARQRGTDPALHLRAGGRQAIGLHPEGVADLQAEQ